MKLRFAPSSLLLVLVAACGGTAPTDPGGKTGAKPVTTLTPPPGAFNGAVTVKLETDIPATVFVTTDGTDPHLEGPNRRSGPSPLEVQLDRTTTLTFFARTEAGAEEELRTATYTRVGGEPGTIAGAVVVGTLALHHEVAVSAGGTLIKLGKPTAPGEVPFTISGLDSGEHRLVAYSDRNDDGEFVPVIDYTSEAVRVVLDLSDPYSASAEGVKIYLAASPPEKATLQGTIGLPKPPANQSLSVSALSGNAFSPDGDPSALLAQLQNGYRVFTNEKDTQYPYAITDLEPGRYVPVPVLAGFGSGGPAMNFLANPLQAVTLEAGKTATADFAFGPVALSGSVTYQPATAPSALYLTGVVAARSASLLKGMQVVLMPTVLVNVGTGEFQGNYAGQALRENAEFQVRLFTNEDGADPFVEALQWSVNPFAPEPAHASVNSGTSDVVLDFTAQ